jgi:hypothetical protein
LTHPFLASIDAQLAGLAGVVRALIATCPDKERQALLHKMELELESVYASLLAESGQHSEAGIRGLDALRLMLLGG